MVHRTVLQYQLLEKIGAGGMGEVYKARDTRLNRFVAMKVLSAGTSSDPDRRMRFIQEAQAVSALNHPNIITIYDVIDDGDTQYMVVEYVDGKTLLELIPKDGLPVPQVIKYAMQMAEALSAAHAAGIIHRDLKPANVMITGSGWVKVLDFGLAKLIDWTRADPDGATVTLMPAPLTIEGTLLGTVNYMSPEQAEGKRVDARSDIFSYGAVLYEMLTGQSAFRGDSVLSILSAVLRDEIQPIRELAPDVPVELERLVESCLKKDPGQRVQSMQEVQAALTVLKQRADSGVLFEVPRASVSIPPAPPVPPPPVPPRPRPRAMPMVAAALTITLAGGVYWWRMHRAAPSHNRSQPVTQVQSFTQAPSSSDAPAHTGKLTNPDIIAMAAARISPADMIHEIQTSKTDFDLSAPEVIRLTKAGVPAQVIAAMRDPKSVPPAVVPTVSVVLNDALPVHLTLAEDIPGDATVGDLVRFKVSRDVSVDDTVVIRTGAPAIGAIIDSPKKRILGLGGKMTFRLDRVDAADGQKVAIRATPLKPAGVSKRPVDAGAKKTTKNVASAAGTAYTGYIDGTRTLLLKK